jgi:hypothetical protein
MICIITNIGHAWSISLRFLCFSLLLSIPSGLSCEENHTCATECSCQTLSDVHCARKLAWHAAKWQPVIMCALQTCSNQGIVTTWNKVAGAVAKHFVGDHEGAISSLLDALNRYSTALFHFLASWLDVWLICVMAFVLDIGDVCPHIREKHLIGGCIILAACSSVFYLQFTSDSQYLECLMDPFVFFFCCVQNWMNHG